MRIRDDGRGFDTNNPPPGLGLRYMRQRTAEVNADLDVISTPGRGTTVQARFSKHKDIAPQKDPPPQKGGPAKRSATSRDGG